MCIFFFLNTMKLLFGTVLFSALWPARVTSDRASDEVTKLPNLRGELCFKHYAGYVNVPALHVVRSLPVRRLTDHSPLRQCSTKSVPAGQETVLLVR
jgi:hypothetical protein